MSNGSSRPSSILVVEDDAGDFSLVRAQARLAGWVLSEKDPVIWAQTLAEGMATARREAPDVILLDLSLPDSSGLATLRAMRAAVPDLPIIVLTRVQGLSLVGDVFEAGAQDYLVKGQFNFDALGRAVRHAVVRNRLEQKIAVNERILATGIEAIDEAFVLFDSDDRLVFCNEKYRSLYAGSADLMVPGVTFEHFIRERVKRGQYSAASGREDEWVAERLAAHRQSNIQLLHQLDNGRWLRIVERKTADGHIVGFRVDVTELQTAKEAAEAASAAKSMFLASMSHEMRTPMNGVLGMLELVSATELTSGQREYIELAQNSARSLLVLLNDILDLSKIEAGKMELEHVKFEPRSVLSETLRALSMCAQEKGLAIDLQIDERIPDFLLGDPTRLSQIIINLLGNAIKFTLKGRVTLAAAVEELGAEGARIAFSVSDTGIGIPREQQGAIFAAFTQADTTTTRKFGGTGLGLAICSRLVALMQGQIEVDSEAGRGSVFRFVVPFGLSAGTADSFQPAVPADLASDVRLRILLAEDNPTNQKYAMAVLANAGHSVTLAQDGEEAVAQALAATFDLILMDVEMPRLDGFGATQAIRAGGFASPIIALTAHAIPGFRERCLAAGMTDYLSKPVRSRDLLSKIAQIHGRAPDRALATEALVPVAGSQAESVAPVLDTAYALELLYGDIDILLMLLPIMPDQIAADRLEIAGAIAGKDAVRVRKASHRLKGSAGQIGAIATQKTCELLEATAASGNCDAFVELQQQLEADLDALVPAIANYLEKCSAATP
ncbi:response regulator [Propionivibrio sp.]|uniref:hybrid sensor histidine kinase/response regulator n=1 Tax=Propionivibrio sp. TaxID=2212460 RepID=UPI003BF2C0F8